MFRTHWELRDGLAQYLYSAFESQSRTGVPVARALVVDSPADTETWAIDDQFLLGDALMFAPAAVDGNPESTSRLVYFPATAPSWHPWFDANTSASAIAIASASASASSGNATTYAPGTWATVPTPIMTAPLFVKGGVPVPFRRRGGDGGDRAATDDYTTTLELLVWSPPPASLSRAPACATAATAWSEIYDDDGESFRHASHGEYWRARAGFAHCRSSSSSNSTQLLLRLQVSHAHERFAAAHANVRWVVRGVASAPARVACNAAAATGSNVGAVALAPRWTHAPGTQELHVSVAGGSSSPSCSVHIAAS